MYKKDILKCIGNTPLLELKNIEKEYNLKFKLFAKLERSNPSGSVKDRAALYIIKEALKNKEIDENSTIIEATSGNTGISLAMICASLNLKCILVMPESASIERVKLMKALGAEVILTKKELGMNGSVNKANELAKEIENSYLTKQFDNISNVNAHYFGTSLEILNDLDNKLDVFIAGFGTSGTLIGCAKRFKEVNKDIKIIGVEPFSSPLVNKNVAGSHEIQGIGANFIPTLYQKDLVDEVIDVTNEDAYKNVMILAKKEGILAGISSGACLEGALKLNDKKEYEGKNVVIILPDNLERYLSVEGLL